MTMPVTPDDWFQQGRTEVEIAIEDGLLDAEEWGGRETFAQDVLSNWSCELSKLPRRKARKAMRALLAGVHSSLEESHAN